MNKLTLNLDDLEVESFATTQDDDDSAAGTVAGYWTHGGTCGVSCGGSCDVTCYTCPGRNCSVSNPCL